MGKKYDEDVPEGHAFAALSGCDRDAMLRRAGFHIHSRPRAGTPIWERNGEVMVEAYALHLAKLELQAKYKGEK